MNYSELPAFTEVTAGKAAKRITMYVTSNNKKGHLSRQPFMIEV